MGVGVVNPISPSTFKSPGAMPRPWKLDIFSSVFTRNAAYLPHKEPSMSYCRPFLRQGAHGVFVCIYYTKIVVLSSAPTESVGMVLFVLCGLYACMLTSLTSSRRVLWSALIASS